MFAKLFQKPTQAEPPPSTSSQLLDTTHESMATSDITPVIAVHYGIPSTASILAFDPIQGLLAVGTLDGKIKVVGGGNIEGLLMSPKSSPFKNLEFLQNQGFLVSVSNDNEIQVWDLEKRRIASNIKWESNITAFSVISGTNFMYLGDEYGFLSVIKYDAAEENILQLSYYVPPNLIAEGAGISLSDHQPIVGVLSQPCSGGNRVLIAYDNGFIILWDVTEDRAVHVKRLEDLQLKGGLVVSFSNNENCTYLHDSLDTDEAEKEISSLCWVSPDGSVLAVGYVDGDILLWDLSVSDQGNCQKSLKLPNDVVKIQLSSGDRRLPVIVLRWSSNKAQNVGRGQLFAYGGVDIGAEEVLTILDLDWSLGLAKLKCIERVDLTLHGSFADLNIISNRYKANNSSGTSFFVLTNPGQLHFYEYESLSILKSKRGKNHSEQAMQYHSVIPTVEPYMTVGKFYMTSSERNIFSTLLKAVSPAKQHPLDTQTIGGKIWPLTGGVPYHMPTTECYAIERIYVGGYQDGTVRIWDATMPVLLLVSLLVFEIKDIEVAGASTPVSALDLSFPNLTLAIGNEFGLIFLYRLQGNSSQATVTIVTETEREVHQYQPEERNQCSAVYSILSSPVRALKFTSSGERLVVGFDSGQIAVLDASSPSVLFVTDCVSSSKSPVISMAVKTCPDTCQNSVDKSDNGAESKSAPEVVFVLTKDAHMVLFDSSTGNMISSKSMHHTEEPTAISIHLLEDKHHLVEGSKSVLVTSSQHTEAETQPLQNALSNVKERDPPNFGHKMLESDILLCCEKALYLYPFESIIQGNNNFAHKLELEKPCSWTTIFKRDAEKYGVIVVFQSGDIEIRSLPELETLGNTSMMSILRWNFKNNMVKTLSASVKGQITLVNGSEFAVISLLTIADENRLLPSLYDKVIAAADADVSCSQSQKKAESAMPGFVSNMIKGLKGVKEEQNMNYPEARDMMIAHLESIFSRFPFSDPLNEYDLEDMNLQLDDIDVEESVPFAASSSQKSSDDIKEMGSERDRLFEGSSSDTKPKVRTREEIIAKYRNTGDAASAASQAKDKLMERQEKLEKLSMRTEELQSGAQNFADMASELAKAMEKRKWWNI